jgi:phage terminase large subunit-like protein
VGRYETYQHVQSGLTYARGVLDGSIVSCKWVKAACQRHFDDLERWPAKDGEFWFDEDEAERVCRFAEMMPHIKGEWARRRERIRLEPWQCFLMMVVFGWRRADGLRRFRTFYLEVARKNAKSTLLAVIGLLMLAADGEAGAEVYSLATTRHQAQIVFRVARAMALREAGYREAYGVKVNAHNLSIDSDEAKFEPQSSDDSSLDGLHVHCGIIDELHAHKTRGVWDVIETATGARSQPLVAAITTAGSNREGICYEQRSYVCRILNTTLKRHDGLGYRVDGDVVTDETYFGMVYTVDEEDDWTNEGCWIKANPNLGVSVRLDDLTRKCAKAMQLASAQPGFLTKHMNVWVNADQAWMDMRAWDRAADGAMKPEDFLGWECVIGQDLASKVDVASTAMLFRREGEYRLFTRHYLPEAAIEDSSNSQIRGWVINGFLTETDGNTIDYDVIESDLREWETQFAVRSISYDPGFAWDFFQRMSNEGLPMVEYRPTVVNYSEPMKVLEELILKGKLKHDGNPVMTWMVSNVVCHRDAKDMIYPRKERNENKIDGAIATIAALGVLMQMKEEAGVVFLGAV